VDHFLIVSEVARRLGVPPRAVSDLFYQRKLDDARCPIVGGGRLIPEAYLPMIEVALRAAGRLSMPADALCPRGDREGEQREVRMASTPVYLADDQDPDDALLGLDDLVSEGLEIGEARAVLGEHSALARRELVERLELLRRERESRR
jgi:hypothetical protein